MITKKEYMHRLKQENTMLGKFFIWMDEKHEQRKRTKTCKECGKTFIPNDLHEKYCSDACRKMAGKKYRQKNKHKINAKYKPMRISNETLAQINSMKKPNESYTEIIERLLHNTKQEDFEDEM